MVLVGHSMGARAALRAAGHPCVTAVAGLAPWLPPGEPVDQLAGRAILLAHGTADIVTSPADTWAYADRARALTTVAEIEVRGGEHAMLRRAACGTPSRPRSPACPSACRRPAGRSAGPWPAPSAPCSDVASWRPGGALPGSLIFFSLAMLLARTGSLAGSQR